MGSDTKLRCGVVGLGMGRGHVKGYQSHPNCEVVAVADLDENRLQNAEENLGIAQTYTDAEQMYAEADLDVVSVVTPNRFHAPLTIAAFEAGCHVLCDKPMAMNLAEAEAMKAAAEAAGKTLAINFSYRFSPMSYALKQQVDSGAIGEIYFGRTVWHRRRGLPGFGGWFGQKEMSGGGPLIDLGVHRIDLALWLMGHPNPISVCGSTYDVIARRLADEQKKAFDCEDLAAGIVKFDNGATLIVEASWALNVNQNEHMVTCLYGDKGGLVQKNRNGTYDFTAEIYTEEGGNLYTKVLDRATVEPPSCYHDFINSILEGRQPVAQAEHGIKVQKILDGMYRSAKEGKEITFA